VHQKNFVATNQSGSIMSRPELPPVEPAILHACWLRRADTAWKFLAAQHRTAPECLAPSQPELEHTACVDGTKRLPIDDPEELSASMGGILCVSHRVRVSESEATGMAARGKRLVLLHGGLPPPPQPPLQCHSPEYIDSEMANDLTTRH
jgi:hypothetical protein